MDDRVRGRNAEALASILGKVRHLILHGHARGNLEVHKEVRKWRQHKLLHFQDTKGGMVVAI